MLHRLYYEISRNSLKFIEVAGRSYEGLSGTFSIYLHLTCKLYYLCLPTACKVGQFLGLLCTLINFN